MRQDRMYWLTTPEHSELFKRAGLVRKPGKPQIGRALARQQGEYSLIWDTARKTFSFSDNLQFPESSLLACIDSHMLACAMGAYDKGGTYSACNSLYDKVAGWCRELAAQYEVPVSSIQALIWVVRKRILDEQLFSNSCMHGVIESMIDAGGKTDNGINIPVDIGNHFMSKHNLEYVLEQATEQEWADALDWYPAAHREIDRLSAKHHIDMQLLCDVVAIISPGREWSTNIQDAADIIILSRQYGIRVEHRVATDQD